MEFKKNHTTDLMIDMTKKKKKGLVVPKVSEVEEWQETCREVEIEVQTKILSDVQPVQTHNIDV